MLEIVKIFKMLDLLNARCCKKRWMEEESYCVQAVRTARQKPKLFISWKVALTQYNL